MTDPMEQQEVQEPEVHLIDEKDLPSSSMSMTMLMEEALASVESYLERATNED